MMAVAVTPNHQIAAIFAATFYSLFNLFSGFFIPRPVRLFSFLIIVFFLSFLT
jgi:ABC-type multidrug transport system permease subunit